MSSPTDSQYDLRPRNARKRRHTNDFDDEAEGSSSVAIEPRTPTLSSRTFASSPITPSSIQSHTYGGGVAVKAENDDEADSTMSPNRNHRGSLIFGQHIRTSPATARQFAARWQYDYAGALTGFLEERHRQWKASRKSSQPAHDALCLVCYSDVSPTTTDGTDSLTPCTTCSRSYHKRCLTPTPATNSTQQPWHCPLCLKRLWNTITPPSQKRHGPPSTFELERRRMALAMQFTRNPAFEHWIEFHDDGTLESDHVLVMAMGVARVEKYLDLDRDAEGGVGM